ncbi:MAG: HNH endonuclease [bacterium]|jgi:5-methylcytosine-specific restriction endonuclease McrA
MRPVNKGDRGNDYPYDLDTDLKTVKPFTFQKQAIVNLVGTNPTLEQVLVDIWLRMVKLNPKKRSRDYDDLNAALPRVKEVIGDTYKQASVPLTTRLGAFCSFCESPVTGLLEVEHIAPKAEYPTYSVIWENFLLACSACNTAKSNIPSRSTVRAWLGNNAPTERQYYDEITKRHYIWPDKDTNAYSGFSVDLYYQSQPSNQWKKLLEQNSVDFENIHLGTDINHRTVRAKIIIRQKKYLTRNVEVRLSANNNNKYAKEMIELCKLNYLGNTGSTYDRRVVNRTEAWFKALKILKSLSEPSIVGNQTAFDTVWLGILTSAASVGFYSVWITILQRLDWSDPSGNALLGRFINETNTSNFFPGTDTANVPQWSDL